MTARPQLVFLLGMPRSGTTWLQRLLGAHPDIGTAQESHLFNHFLGSQLQAWDHLLGFEDGRGGIGLPAYQREAEFLDMLHRQVREVLAKAPEYGKGRYFLEKTPDHVRHLLDIQRVVPDARIVLILRRPADVVESMLSAGAGWGRHWAPGSILRAVRLYRYFSGKAAADLALADPRRLHVVHYEELKRSPAWVLEALLGFLELDADPATLERMIASPAELRCYGEFAKRDGGDVEEPEGFRRASKGRLSLLQRALVRATLGDDALGVDEKGLLAKKGARA